jgi:hypothetical protein
MVVSIENTTHRILMSLVKKLAYNSNGCKKLSQVEIYFIKSHSFYELSMNSTSTMPPFVTSLLLLFEEPTNINTIDDLKTTT